MNFLDERVPMRIWNKLAPCPISGCWLWTGHTMPNGYAQAQGFGATAGKKHLIHRSMFVLAFGPVPEGLEVDHKCRVRCCANPQHLEAITHRENILRGNTFGARNAAATHCPKEHPYDEENTGHATGADPARRRGRRCRACHRAHVLRYERDNGAKIYARRKAKRLERAA